MTRSPDLDLARQLGNLRPRPQALIVIDAAAHPNRRSILAGDVSLVAGSRGKVIVLEAGRDGLSLRKMPAALAAIARADLVLLPSDEPGPVAALARRMTSPQRRASIRAPEGAHEAARHAYFAAIADALIGVDADGLFSYADRAELAAAGHASDAR